MTVQNAIKILKTEYLGDSEYMELAKQMGAYALEKQIPKKPYKRKEHKQNDYYCAVCRYYLGDEMELKFAGLQPKFCPECGQALDWSDENDL